MDFGSRLSDVFAEKLLISEDEFLSRIRCWNGEVEEYLANPPTEMRYQNEKVISGETISEVASYLGRGIVSVVLQRRDASAAEGDGDLEEDYQHAIENFRETPLSPCPQILSEYIRASKNFLRWHIQIVLAQVPTIMLPLPVSQLQSSYLIDLLVMMLEQYALRDATTNQDVARSISLHLFYATYVVSPKDEVTRNAIDHLTLRLRFPQLVLRILTRSCTAALSLSLIRNINNAVVSLQGASNIVLSATVDWKATDDSFSDPAPWSPSTSTSSLDFKTICINILRWAISSSPPFPGDKMDSRADLVSEILSAFYAIRGGSDHGFSKEALVDTMVDILCLSNDHGDKRVTRCKLSIMPLLMDSDNRLGKALFEKGAIPNLLDLFANEVTDVVANTRVDNSATASLVPMLVVLNKYATAHPEVHDLVKESVFPLQDDAVFLEKIRECQAEMSRNMSPLDAPDGTLRRHLCTLLTWPESHVKRCTGELLWTLSSSNPTEYVHRVGFGNALPLLSVKGFARMPQ